MIKIALCIAVLCHRTTGFWDTGTTTVRLPRTDDTPRTSFFRWQWIAPSSWLYWFSGYDWDEIYRRRRLGCMAGISIDMLCITTASILNRRILISSYNPFDPYMHRAQDLRIWALGRAGRHNTPYRYRVHRLTRMFPLSANPEHCHGPRCTHQPRHDISILVSLDQMYVYPYEHSGYHYAKRAYIPPPTRVLDGDLWFAGSGYEYMQHIMENYKIFYSLVSRDDIVDCSIYIPKWWGKFICVKNTQVFPGIQNGGGLFVSLSVVGIGCFEIRLNDDRIFVFTDLRYYFHSIHHYVELKTYGQYYEYAYPQWSVKLYHWKNPRDSEYNTPYIPGWQIMKDLYPLG